MREAESALDMDIVALETSLRQVKDTVSKISAELHSSTQKYKVLAHIHVWKILIFIDFFLGHDPQDGQ